MRRGSGHNGSLRSSAVTAAQWNDTAGQEEAFASGNASFAERSPHRLSSRDSNGHGWTGGNAKRQPTRRARLIVPHGGSATRNDHHPLVATSTARQGDSAAAIASGDAAGTGTGARTPPSGCRHATAGARELAWRVPHAAGQGATAHSPRQPTRTHRRAAALPQLQYRHLLRVRRPPATAAQKRPVRRRAGTAGAGATAADAHLRVCRERRRRRRRRRIVASLAAHRGVWEEFRERAAALAIQQRALRFVAAADRGGERRDGARAVARGIRQFTVRCPVRGGRRRARWTAATVAGHAAALA
eukprot:ctg_93.g20